MGCTWLTEWLYQAVLLSRSKSAQNKTGCFEVRERVSCLATAHCQYLALCSASDSRWRGYGAPVQWCRQETTEVHREKPIPLPNDVTQISAGQTWNRTRASALWFRRPASCITGLGLQNQQDYTRVVLPTAPRANLSLSAQSVPLPVQQAGSLLTLPPVHQTAVLLYSTRLSAIYIALS